MTFAIGDVQAADELLVVARWIGVGICGDEAAEVCHGNRFVSGYFAGGGGREERVALL